MKNISILAILGLALFVSCSQDDLLNDLDTPYTISIEGAAPNAKMVITNNSTEGSTYHWNFGLGASISSSTDKTPTGIIVDKAGDLSVNLIVTNGTESKEYSSTVKVSGKSAIVIYKDVAFGQAENDPKFGRFFSTSEGRIYKQSEVNTTTGPKIDLVYSGDLSINIFFENPTNLFSDTFTIPGATFTKVDNYMSGFLVSDFDAMVDDALLSSLTVVNDNGIIGSTKFPLIVLFENASGKKGAIKLKTFDVNRLLVDIKVQKY